MADHARMTNILAHVQQEFNDTSGTIITSSNIVTLLNACQQEIAQRGYWIKSANTNIVASQYEYALTTLFTDLLKVLGVWYYDSDDSLYKEAVPCSTYDTYAYLREGGTSSSARPYRYYIQYKTLMLWPTPDSAVTNGLKVRYQYMPTAFTDLTAAPTTPQSHDRIYEAFVLMRKYAQDKTRPQGDIALRQYAMEYEMWMRRLIGDEIEQTPIRIIPGR